MMVSCVDIPKSPRGGEASPDSLDRRAPRARENYFTTSQGHVRRTELTGIYLTCLTNQHMPLVVTRMTEHRDNNCKLMELVCGAANEHEVLKYRWHRTRRKWKQ